MQVWVHGLLPIASLACGILLQDFSRLRDAYARRAYDYSPEEKGAQAMQQEAPTAQAATKIPVLPLHVRAANLRAVNLRNLCHLCSCFLPPYAPSHEHNRLPGSVSVMLRMMHAQLAAGLTAVLPACFRWT